MTLKSLVDVDGKVSSCQVGANKFIEDIVGGGAGRDINAGDSRAAKSCALHDDRSWSILFTGRRALVEADCGCSMSASIASISSAVISGNDGIRGAGGGAIVSSVDALSLMTLILVRVAVMYSRIPASGQ